MITYYTPFLTLFILSMITLVCSSTCPSQATPGESCKSLGEKCRYNPIGCTDGIQFATTCECTGRRIRKARYSCTTINVECETMFPGCPKITPVQQKCDPALVEYCAYSPYGCPGSTEPGKFIEHCYCDTFMKEFQCVSAGRLPCS
jgi:hypothetical protein